MLEELLRGYVRRGVVWACDDGCAVVGAVDGEEVGEGVEVGEAEDGGGCGEDG